MPRLGGARSGFTLYTEGDDLYDTMLSEISRARSQVLLESYIFAGDEVGDRFAAALCARAQAGVEVRLLVDAAGSFGRFPRALERRLRDTGVTVRRFHRWQWRNPWRYNRRDHRKLMVVDGAAAFIGGFNIHRESSRRVYGPRRWRDTHVRLTGDAAAHARALFEAFWCGERGLPDVGQDAATVLLPNHTRQCRYRLGCVYDAVFGRARTSLDLATPYFVPSRRLRTALQRAAQRGVRVRLLVPRVSDVAVARWAGAAATAEMLGHGIQVFEYLPRMLHAKTAVADGSWAVLGTANLDHRSVFLNYELVVATRDPALCRALQQQFDADVDESAEVQLDYWRRRRWLLRVAEWVAWSVRRWL